MNTNKTFVNSLHQCADHQPHQHGEPFLLVGEADECLLPYAELYTSVWTIAIQV